MINSFWKKYKDADYFKRNEMLKTLNFKGVIKEDPILEHAFYSTLQSYIDDIIYGDDD